MSRLRTGHGPDDWEPQEPSEAPWMTAGTVIGLGGALVTSVGHKAPTGLSQVTGAEAARRHRRSVAMKEARRLART